MQPPANRLDPAAAERFQPGFTLLVTALLAVVWIVTSWLLADQYAKWRSSDLLAAHTEQINRITDTIALGVDREALARIDGEAEAEIAAAVEAATAAAWPEPAEAYRDVQDVGQGRWY